MDTPGMRTVIPLALLASLFGAQAHADGAVGFFSHDIHVGNFEVKCLDCHELPPVGTPVLKKQTCLECHEKYPPAFKASKRQKLSLTFPHQAHGKVLECLDCHQRVLDDNRVRTAPVMERKACADCHTRRGLKTAERHCEACHESNQRLVRPQDHDRGWLELHGQAGDMRGTEEHGHDCNACHGAEACIRCHKERKPRSHTGLWDVRMHGIAASFDREGCQTCHETGLCVRCHTSTRPMNHTAGWPSLHGLAAAATDNEHCRACHTPAQCTGCHRPGL